MFFICFFSRPVSDNPFSPFTLSTEYFFVDIQMFCSAFHSWAWRTTRYLEDSINLSNTFLFKKKRICFVDSSILLLYFLIYFEFLYFLHITRNFIARIWDVTFLRLTTEFLRTYTPDFEAMEKCKMNEPRRGKLGKL